jgi:outer membrane protein OmpA-like peptidoglycan-associated protein/Tol biopolymer transport system component
MNRAMNFKHMHFSLHRFVCLFFLISFGYPQIVNSQNNETLLDELINEGNFEQAIIIGKELLQKQPENPGLNFKVGYCIMNTPLMKSEAIPYLQKADEVFSISNVQTYKAIETRFYLGKAYHKNYEFDKALGIFEQMKIEVKNKEMLQAIEEEIEQSRNGKKLFANPIKMQITNLSNIINSEYTDHSPVISADESVLIFTSRRKRFDNEMLKPDGQYNEDIYISNFDQNGWSQPKSISPNINSESHEASIGISADGQQLLIYNDAEGGTILISKLMGDVWSNPVNAGSNINTRYRETHASFSADGQYIYFTSDRPGGYGGLDIYVSAIQADGTWGKALNLGAAINTDKDEEGPFIHHDGITLYFSSKGHESMGGYDIFLSKSNEFGTWNIAENLGYPVNTTEDDVFFVMTPDGKRAYFASFREGGNGSSDIYMMGLPEAEEKPVTIVKGMIAVCKSDIENVQISVYESGKSEIVGLYKPNSKTGKYLFILTRGKEYEAVYEIIGKEVHKELFHIGDDTDFQIIYKHIELRTAEPCKEFIGLEDKNEEIAEIDSIIHYIAENEDEDKFNIENIMFKVNSSEASYFTENLKKMSDYLKANSETKIEIIGYSDTQGQEAYNLKLSEKRAQAIYRTLIKFGVDKNQLSYRGDGEKNQITINNYSDGSYVWQSLPYNRRVEFKVLDDPIKKLNIVPFKIPKVYITHLDSVSVTSFKDYEQLFTIQIGAYSKPIGLNYFQKLKNIQMFYTGRLYHYTIGEFDSEDLASDELRKIYDLGYKDAFIRRISFYFSKKLFNAN